MTPNDFLAVAGWMVAALFGMLCAILGWIGNKIFEKLNSMSDDIHKLASELHERVNGLDRRVTIIETKCATNHSRDRE